MCVVCAVFVVCCVCAVPSSHGIVMVLLPAVVLCFLMFVMWILVPPYVQHAQLMFPHVAHKIRYEPHKIRHVGLMNPYERHARPYDGPYEYIRCACPHKLLWIHKHSYVIIPQHKVDHFVMFRQTGLKPDSNPNWRFVTHDSEMIKPTS